MDYAKIFARANCLIAQTYGSTAIPAKGSVVVTVDDVKYIVHFIKVETGWITTTVEKC